MNILVNGAGLIGSSIIRIIKKAHPEMKVVGSDRHQVNLDYLLKNGLIDAKVPFTKAAPRADVIILATPVNVIVQTLKQLANFKLKPNVLVTDVGSSKQLIMNAAKPLMRTRTHFLGGHPFAGSHLTGSVNGSLDLFKGHAYFLVNGNATEHEVNQFKVLLSAAGTHFKMISAQHHDQLLSFMSHLPHVVAFSLINTIAPQLRAMGVSPKIGAGGIRDTTRIAMGDPDVWTSTFNSNSALIVDQINRFEKSLNHLKSAIQNHQTKAVRKQILAANQVRKDMEGCN